MSATAASFRPRLKLHCRECKCTTNHELTHVEKWGGFSENVGQFGGTYEIVQCLGCDAFGFRQTDWCSDDVNYETGDVAAHETLFPDTRKEARKSAVPIHLLPLKPRGVYQETLKAFNAGAHLLTAAGLRALVESICVERGTKGGNLQTKIDDLVALGALAKQQADFLHFHRALGNEAVHEIVAPPIAELVAALDIVESLMRTIYELPDTADELKALRERRQKAKTETAKKVAPKRLAAPKKAASKKASP